LTRGGNLAGIGFAFCHVREWEQFPLTYGYGLGTFP
jgi:hypothetical protein